MRASWVSQQNYHVTLRFLGDIDPMLTVDLRALADDVADTVSPFECVLDRVGTFPQPERARVLWIGGDAPDGFGRLADELSRGLGELGFGRVRRESVVHVTIARVKGRPDPALADVIGRTNPSAPLRMTADRLVLMESLLTPQGAVYTPLFTCRLGGREAPDGAD